MRRPVLTACLLAATVLAGCDMLGIESPEKLAAVREADGKAVGGACRHAARAIEDCYAMNRKADRAAIFAGWRDMNDYMRENKIEPVVPQGVASAHAAKVVAAEPTPEPATPAPDKRGGKPADAGRTKASRAS